MQPDRCNLASLVSFATPRVSECDYGEEISVKSAAFDVSDNDESIPDEPSSVFSPGEREPGYTISIKPRDEPGSDPLIPMDISPTRGSNIKQTTVRIFPEDGSQPTEIVVSCDTIFALCNYPVDHYLVALNQSFHRPLLMSRGFISANSRPEGRCRSDRVL